MIDSLPSFFYIVHKFTTIKIYVNASSLQNYLSIKNLNNFRSGWFQEPHKVSNTFSEKFLQAQSKRKTMLFPLP